MSAKRERLDARGEARHFLNWPSGETRLFLQLVIISVMSQISKESVPFGITGSGRPSIMATREEYILPRIASTEIHPSSPLLWHLAHTLAVGSNHILLTDSLPGAGVWRPLHRHGISDCGCHARKRGCGGTGGRTSTASAAADRALGDRGRRAGTASAAPALRR